jgi:hypothetical protein
MATRGFNKFLSFYAQASYMEFMIELKERHLRRWLRRSWGETGIEWIEAGLGGTQGLPDVKLFAQGRELGVELKIGVQAKAGLRIRLRPSQARYHKLMALEGRQTAFLIGLGMGSSFTVFAASGHLVTSYGPVIPCSELIRVAEHQGENVSVDRQRIQAVLFGGVDVEAGSASAGT